MVSGHTGLSVKQCKAKYNSALAENYKKTGGKRNEAAVSAVYMTKLCYEFPRNAKAVERNWTPEEIRLLRMARGASKRCDSWERVAAFVGNGRTKQDCMEVWKVGCHKALELAALRVEAKNRIELKKATEIKEHWTPQELTRLRTLLDSKSSTNAAKMDAAVAMFPEKSKSKVCTMVKYLRHDARQQKLKQTEGPAGNSYFISAAQLKGLCGKLKDTDAQSLLGHVRTRFRSSIQNNIGSTIKIANYTALREINVEESPNVSSNGFQENSNYLSKDVLEFSKWIPYTYIGWTADEVARLRNARGGRNPQFRDWDSVVEHVGNGKTKDSCLFIWKRLCSVDDLLELSKGQEVSAVPKETDTAAPFGEWTPDEAMQLKTRMDASPSYKDFKLRIAYAMFPHKSRMHVCAKVRSLRGVSATDRSGVRLLITEKMLVQLVSDYGGVKIADWDAISKQCGVSVSRCQKIYLKTVLRKLVNERWSSAEENRLLAALRRQHALGGSYDWDAVAVAVETRTRQQSFAWYLSNRPRMKRYLDRLDLSLLRKRLD
ncbi:hypothetical protein GGI23_000191 [Coemansia sp. RSA 2559]|nr:hypothetical protein GGI23_000191 [Coemansia sp. RSA 2559]